VDWSREVNDMRSTPSRRRHPDGLIRRYVADRLVAERRAPTDSLFGSLLADPAAEDPLTDAELITIGSTLIVAGQDTTANAISLAALTMMQTPGMVREINDRPESVTGICEEFLRYHSIVHLGITRRTVTATEIAGLAVPAGTAVVCSLADANFDAALFAEPARLDTRRRPCRHLAFGHGPHLCLGQHLARVEMIQSMIRLAQRIPTMRLAVPLDALRGKANMTVFGVTSLPVTWDRIALVDPSNER
jgi:cytochrome P450